MRVTLPAPSRLFPPAHAATLGPPRRWSICTQHHTVEERMSRRLPEDGPTHGADRFELTQEFLADVLVVHRRGTSLKARVLRSAMLIEYRRGGRTALNQPGLVEASCECFRVTSPVHDRMMRLP